MPRVMNPHDYSQLGTSMRTAPQKVCISLGIAFFVIGLLGVLIPNFLGMHLSMAHNMVHFVSGTLALWCGFTSSNRSIAFSIIFGTVYGLLGVAGYVLGEPGYPAVGSMEADQNLFRIIPNYLEFGTMDHIVHLLIGAFLLFTAFTFRKDKREMRNPNINEFRHE